MTAQSHPQFTLAKPNHIISLATSCMLVSVEISVWTATKQDREISDEITTAKKADRNAGRFVKHILGNDPDHKAVLNYRQTVYNWLQRRTYAWAGSQRALPVVDLPVFMQEYNHHEAVFKGLVQVLLNKLPGIISNMAFVQGTMFKRSDYPTIQEVDSKFSMQLYTSPIPESDYRCQIAQDLAEDLHNNYCRQAQQLIDGIVLKQTEQLLTVMESLSHCCDTELVEDKKNGGQKVKRRKIYDTTVNRALELCETFKSFNLSNNPELEAARSALESVLTGINLTALKDSDALREQVKTGIDDILTKFRPAATAAGAETEVEDAEPIVSTLSDLTESTVDDPQATVIEAEQYENDSDVLDAEDHLAISDNTPEDDIGDPILSAKLPPIPVHIPVYTGRDVLSADINEDTEDEEDIRAIIAKYSKTGA